MPSIFSKIISGDIPCYKIAETEHCLAFLDIFPVQRGHVLVIPKKEVDHIFDLEDELFSELHLFSKKVAKAIKQAFSCEKIGVSVIGLEVPHAHIHLMPIDQLSDMNFTKPKLKLQPQELSEIATQIRAYYTP